MAPHLPETQSKPSGGSFLPEGEDLAIKSTISTAMRTNAGYDDASITVAIASARERVCKELLSRLGASNTSRWLVNLSATRRYSLYG